MAAVVACHYPLQLHPSRRTALSLWQRAFPAQQVDSTSDSSGGIGGIDATTFRRRFNIYTVRPYRQQSIIYVLVIAFAKMRAYCSKAVLMATVYVLRPLLYLR